MSEREVFGTLFQFISIQENESRSLWNYKTTLTSLDQFPGKSRWSEVIEMNDEEFGPLECAIKSMKAKNEDLERTLHKYYDHQDTSLNELEMLLAGTIGKNYLIRSVSKLSGRVCRMISPLSKVVAWICKVLRNPE